MEDKVEQKTQSLLLVWFWGEPIMCYQEVIAKVSEFIQPIALLK